MRPFDEIKRKILFEYLEKYPDLPSYSMAQAIYSKYPEYWTNAETVRGHIRRYRGKSGEHHRNKMKNQKYYVKD